MTDTDLLHMAALEAKLTEAEQLLAQTHAALYHATYPEWFDAELIDEYMCKIRNFLGVDLHGNKI